MTAIDDRTRDILENAQYDGTKLVLPGQLDRKEYVRVDKLLRALGGAWDRKAKAHVFPEDPESAVQRVLETGEEPLHPRKGEGFVRTPRPVVDIMMQFADPGDLPPDSLILEPSAGDGALANVISELAPDCMVIAVEPNVGRSAGIERLAAAVWNMRFEEFLHVSDRPERPVDLVVMNPPFAVPSRPTIWIDHVLHAWSLLAPGGRLVTLVPSGFDFRDDKRHREIRDWHARYGGERHEIDPAHFDGVHTRVLVVDKPDDWTPDADRPAKKGKPTPEEKKAQRDADRELSQAASDALEDPEFAEDLVTRLNRLPVDARLRAYSPRNAAMVYAQADALGIKLSGELRTFGGWRQQGRRVVTGPGTGLRVISPRDDRKAQTDDTASDDGGGEDQGEKQRGFWAQVLFDRAQTEPFGE